MSVVENNSAQNLNSESMGRLSDSEDTTSSGHSSDDDNENENNDSGHPIMSIFASYYGIEDTTVGNTDNQIKNTIDDAGFQAENYVKVSFKN